MQNYNEKTGVPYGYIAANELWPDLVHELLYEHGVDRSFEAAEWEFAYDIGYEEGREDIEAFKCINEAEFQEFYDNWQDDEPVVDGKHEGVVYVSSWLGGALNFFILESPVVTNTARQCSPCVSGAGDLGSEGDFTCYDVPKDWRAEEI